MTVDKPAEDQGTSGPRVNGMQPSRGMDDDGQQGSPHRLLPGKRRSSKNKAPPPPPVLHGPRVSSNIPAFPHAAMEQKENLLEQELLLTVVLPEGVEKTTVVQGSKPMMDLLVMLCAKYHLNPSSHTIELVSTNRNHIKFKPNALIGTLEAEKVLLKPKGMEDKNKKTGPQMPEATVRMVINFKKTQKTILRVNPRLPLQELLPAICEKCEFEPHSTELLRNVHSEEPLDLSNSLSELGLREVYARDTRVIGPAGVPPSPTHSDVIQPGKDKLQKEKENKGLFSLFKRGSKKKHDQASTGSAPASPVHRKQRPISMSSLSTHSPTYDSNTMPSDTPKKRRAPLPPHMMPSNLSNQQINNQASAQPDGIQATAALSRSSSAGSSLKRSKRKAPQPPTSPSSPPAAPDEATQDKAMTGLQLALDKIQEKEETPAALSTPESSSPARASPISPSPDSPSPMQEQLEDDSSINLSANISLDSGRAGTASPSQDSEMENVAPPGGSSEEVSCDLTTDGKLAADSGVNGDQPENDAQLQPADNGSLTTESNVTTNEESSSIAVVLQDNTLQHPALPDAHTVTQTQRAEPQVPSRSGPAEASGHVAQNAAPMEASGQEMQNAAPVVSHTHTQIQTEMWCEPTEPDPSPPSPPELIPSPSSPSASSKRDMATSTEELNVKEIHPSPVQPFPQPEIHSSTYTDAPETQTSTNILASEGQLSTQIPSATKAGNLHYVTEFEPKPKPSNELTRNYIPKVGMTTYTIVPQKSLDKLRFFEVELTLESRSMAGIQDLSTGGSEGIGQPPGISGPTTVPPHSFNSPAAALQSASSELSHSVPSSPASPEADVSSFTAVRAGPEVKQKKVPPTTRPKPASFRLPQHKRTPGSYVSSAAVRSMSVSDSGSSSTAGGGQREALGSPRRESYPGATQEDFPPPAPPFQSEGKKETAEVQQVASPVHLQKQQELGRPTNTHSLLCPKEAEVASRTGRPPLPRQMSLPSKEPTAGLSLEKLRSFAAPKPYSATASSRFAQAVSSAVKRSNSLTLSPVGQYGCKVPLACTKHSPIRESLDLPESPTKTDVASGLRKASSEISTSPVECSDSAPSASPDKVEGMWNNETTDLSSGSVVSPLPKSLPDAAGFQEE